MGNDAYSQWNGMLSAGKQSSDNQYQFNEGLIKDEQLDISTFSSIVNRQAMLANLGDRDEAQYHQTMAGILTQAFSMQKMDPSLKGFFEVVYFTWFNELKLTRAYAAREREFMAAGGTTYVPNAGMPQQFAQGQPQVMMIDPATGTAYNQNMQPQQSGPPAGNIIERVLGRRK